MSKNKINFLIWGSILAPFLFIVYFLIASYMVPETVAPPQYDVLISGKRKISSKDAAEKKIPTNIYYRLDIDKGKLFASAILYFDKKGGKYTELLLYRFNPESKKLTRLTALFTKKIKTVDGWKWHIKSPELEGIKIFLPDKAPDGYVYLHDEELTFSFLPNLRVIQKDGRRFDLPTTIGDDRYSYKVHGWIKREEVQKNE